MYSQSIFLQFCCKIIQKPLSYQQNWHKNFYQSNCLTKILFLLSLFLFCLVYLIIFLKTKQIYYIKQCAEYFLRQFSQFLLYCQLKLSVLLMVLFTLVVMFRTIRSYVQNLQFVIQLVSAWHQAEFFFIILLLAQ